jgi:integrase
MTTPSTTRTAEVDVVAAFAAVTEVAADQLGVDVAAADRYAAAGVAANTRRAYASDWSDFTTYCAACGVAALPAAESTVRAYIAHLADQGRKVATIRRRVASIAAVHHVAGVPTPTTSTEVRATLRGIAREVGTAQRAVAPVEVDVLSAMVATIPQTMHGRRDRALLALGFAAALRRSELVALKVEDVAFVPKGVELTIRRSKTDQTAQGRRVAVPFGRKSGVCPVTLLREWLDASGISSGPLFRRVDRHGNVGATALDGSSVARIVKSNADAVGHDAERFAGHSLRAGFVTSAVRARVPVHRIMDQTGHQSDTSFRRYIRYADAFEDNAAAEVL